jgi:hypothetical protein
MRLKSRLIGFASIGLLVAFAASDTFAQGAQPGAKSSPPSTSAPNAASPAQGKGAAPSASTQSKAGASAASQGPWTADNVTAARPFGEINIQAAGTTDASVRTWAQARTPAERAELNGRCAVINNPANSARYQADAKQFCTRYEMVAALNPPAGSPSSPSTVPGAAGKSSAPGGKTP